MGKARKVKQLSFTMPDRAGLLSEVTSAIAGAKVNITSICAYGMENTAYFILTTESNAKAKKALAQLGVTVEEKDAIAVEMPNKAGELEKVAKRIAEAGIYINYIYGTAGPGKTSTCIIMTADNPKAIKVVNKK